MTRSESDWVLRTAEGRPARELWTLEKGRIHLNHGSYGGITQGTARCQQQILDRMRTMPGRWFADLPDRVGEAVADVVGALGLERVAVAPTVNASAAATVAFRGLALPAGSTALINNHNYGAVVHSLRRSQPGLRVREIAIPLEASDGEILSIYEWALTRDVSVVLLDQFTSPTAKAFPVDELISMVRSAGAVSVVDGAHAPGMLAQPLPSPAPDVWFGNLHKHLCGPISSALIAVRADVGGGLWPLIDSWNEGQPFPARFFTQGAVDFSALLAAPEAHAEIDERLGWERVRAHATSLTANARDLVADAIAAAWAMDPHVNLPNAAPHFALLKLPDWPAPERDRSAELRALLSRKAGIEAMVVSWMGHHYLRLCSHAYNTRADYEALATLGIDVLHRHWTAETRAPQG